MKSDELRACWYRLRRKINGKWEILPHEGGRLHIFTTDHIEYESGPGPYPVAVIEDDETGTVHVVPAQDVCFGMVPKFATES